MTNLLCSGYREGWRRKSIGKCSRSSKRQSKRINKTNPTKTSLSQDSRHLQATMIANINRTDMKVKMTIHILLTNLRPFCLWSTSVKIFSQTDRQVIRLILNIKNTWIEGKEERTSNKSQVNVDFHLQMGLFKMKNRLTQRLKTVNYKKHNNIWGSVNKLLAIFVNLPKRTKKKLVKDKIDQILKLKCIIHLEIKALEEEWANNCLLQNLMLLRRWQSHLWPIPWKVRFSIIIRGKVTLAQTVTLSQTMNLAKEALSNSKDKELTLKGCHLLV